MVLIGGVKYACERCIRGHRVTTCNHTDQPLIMIKPKGRPSSQCKHCKNLRVAKNVHSSGSCTCGRNNTANGVASGGLKKKKCGCETGKSCDCHKKKQTSTVTSRNNSTTSSQGDSIPVPSVIDSDSKTNNINNNISNKSNNINTPPETLIKSKRVGEVSIPINEYIPASSNEIGNVLNEKAVSGFFQDVPLPFEPGHGLLDLFEKSSSRSSSQLTSNHYNTFSSNGNYGSNNKTGPHNDFDVFQNLVLTPDSTTNQPLNQQSSLFSSNTGQTNGFRTHQDTSSINDNISEHSVTSYTSNHTVNSTHTGNNSLINNTNGYSKASQGQDRQSSGLFGSYQTYNNNNENNINNNNNSIHNTTNNADSTVEVLSLTPSFNDIIPDYENYNVSHTKNQNNGVTTNKFIPNTKVTEYETYNHSNPTTASNSELLKSLNMN